MGSTRFIGVTIFYALGIVFSIFGTLIACYYQENSTRNMWVAKANLKAVGYHIPGIIRELAATQGKLSPSERKELELRDMTMRRRWVETRNELVRVEGEYRTGMRRRNHAMMISILGFALMVWGLFRLLKD